MFVKLFLLSLYLVILLNTVNCVFQTPFEQQQEKVPELLTILLQPTIDGQRPFKRRLQGQRPHFAPSPQPTTEELDYYDAVRLEDEQQPSAPPQQQQRMPDEAGNTAAMMHMFTALQANIAPLSSLLVVDSNVNNGTTMEDKNGKSKKSNGTEEKRKFVRVDGDTAYDEKTEIESEMGDDTPTTVVDADTTTFDTNRAFKIAEKKLELMKANSLKKQSVKEFKGMKAILVDGKTNKTEEGRSASSSEESEDDDADDEEDKEEAKVKGGTVIVDADTKTQQNVTVTTTMLLVDNDTRTDGNTGTMLMPIPPQAKIFTSV